MRIDKALFLLLMAFSVRAFAAPIDCTSPAQTAEFNQCAELENKEADKKLNLSYRKVMAALSDEDKKALVAAQRDWLKIRDAQCELETKGLKSGTIWYEINTECKTRLTINRTLDIESILKYR
jgi:uncharacterized protein YecT (DUF1311 family)